MTNTCATCAHCDRDEATKVPERGSVVQHVVVGMCTRQYGWFNGQRVIDWMTGCPDFDPIAAEALVERTD